jgi:hypothetical protein
LLGEQNKIYIYVLEFSKKNGFKEFTLESDIQDEYEVLNIAESKGYSKKNLISMNTSLLRKS